MAAGELLPTAAGLVAVRLATTIPISRDRRRPHDRPSDETRHLFDPRRRSRRRWESRRGNLRPSSAHVLGGLRHRGVRGRGWSITDRSTRSIGWRFGRRSWTGPSTDLSRVTLPRVLVRWLRPSALADGWGHFARELAYIASTRPRPVLNTQSETRCSRLITLVGRALFHSWTTSNNADLLHGGVWRVSPTESLRPDFLATPGHRHADPGWLLMAHGAATWKLRERQLMMAIEEATDVDRTKWRFLAHGARVGKGFPSWASVRTCRQGLVSQAARPSRGTTVVSGADDRDRGSLRHRRHATPRTPESGEWISGSARWAFAGMGAPTRDGGLRRRWTRARELRVT
jgi:hypothetical protein